MSTEEQALDGQQAGKEGAATQSKAVAKKADGVFMGFSLAQAIFAISWPVLVLVSLYAFVLVPRLDAIEAGIRSRPSIKVVNTDNVVRSYIAQGMTADAAITKADGQFRRMAERGFIVLRNSDVLAAPKSVKQP